MAIETKTARVTTEGLLGVNVRDSFALARRVEAGLSFDSMERLSKRSGLPLEILRAAVRIPPRTLARRRGDNRLTPQESDRLVSVSRLIALAVDLFGGRVGNAAKWLTSPNRALGRLTPIDVARTEVGSREVENLIGRLKHGVFT